MFSQFPQQMALDSTFICFPGVPGETSEHPRGPGLPKRPLPDTTGRLPRGDIPPPRHGGERRFQKPVVAVRTNTARRRGIRQLLSLPAARYEQTHQPNQSFSNVLNQQQ